MIAVETNGSEVRAAAPPLDLGQLAADALEKLATARRDLARKILTSGAWAADADALVRLEQDAYNAITGHARHLPIDEPTMPFWRMALALRKHEATVDDLENFAALLRAEVRP